MALHLKYIQNRFLYCNQMRQMTRPVRLKFLQANWAVNFSHILPIQIDNLWCEKMMWLCFLILEKKKCLKCTHCTVTKYTPHVLNILFKTLTRNISWLLIPLHEMQYYVDKWKIFFQQTFYLVNHLNIKPVEDGILLFCFNEPQWPLSRLSTGFFLRLYLNFTWWLDP